MLVLPDVTKSIVLTCCVLHNAIRVREGKLSEVYCEIVNTGEDCDVEQETLRARAAKAAYKVREYWLCWFFLMLSLIHI